MYTTILIPNHLPKVTLPNDLVILTQAEADTIRQIIFDFKSIAEEIKTAYLMDKEKLTNEIIKFEELAKNLAQQVTTLEQQIITYKQQISQLAAENAQLKAEKPV